MHSHIQQLYTLASKPSRTIIGLMSGTSLDGLDVALCQLSGDGLNTRVELLKFATVDYDADYKQRVKALFAKLGTHGRIETVQHILAQPKK